MNKDKLIELRCKAWGITEGEYYCNQCSDFSLEDMARAYRRGKNKGRADIAKENAELKERLLKVENAYKRKSEAEWHLNDLYQKLLTDFANAEKCSREYFTRYRAMIDRYAKAEELLKWFVWYFKEGCLNLVPYTHKVEEVEQFIKDLEK